MTNLNVSGNLNINNNLNINGKVGIGITNPEKALDIVGDIKTTGAYNIFITLFIAILK